MSSLSTLLALPPKSDLLQFRKHLICSNMTVIINNPYKINTHYFYLVHNTAVKIQSNRLNLKLNIIKLSCIPSLQRKHHTITDTRHIVWNPHPTMLKFIDATNYGCPLGGTSSVAFSETRQSMPTDRPHHVQDRRTHARTQLIVQLEPD